MLATLNRSVYIALATVSDSNHYWQMRKHQVCISGVMAFASVRTVLAIHL